MFSVKKIAGFLKRVGNRDGGNKDEHGNPKGGAAGGSAANTAAAGEKGGSFSPAGARSPAGERTTSATGDTATGASHSTVAATPILHGLPQNADTQAVLRHVFNVVFKKSQFVVDEAPWLLQANRPTAIPTNPILGSVDSAAEARKPRTASTTATAAAAVTPLRGTAADRASLPAVGSDHRRKTPETPPHGHHHGGGSASAHNSPPRFSISSATGSPKQGPAAAPPSPSAHSTPPANIIRARPVAADDETQQQPQPQPQGARPATPHSSRVLLPPSMSAVGSREQLPSLPAKDVGLSSSKAYVAVTSSSNTGKVLHPGVNLLESLQKERAEMMEALDVCLQEVPDCDDEWELVQHVLDAITLEQQKQMQLQQQQQAHRRKLQLHLQQHRGSATYREARHDSVVSGVLSPPAMETSLEAAAGREDSSSHHHHHHQTPRRATKRPTKRRSSGVASDDANDISVDDGPHSVEEDAENEFNDGEPDGPDEDADEEEDGDGLYGEDRSYIVDIDGDDENDTSTVFSYSGPALSSSVGGGAGTVGARLSQAMGVSQHFAPISSYLFARNASLAHSSAAANSQAVVLRAMALANRHAAHADPHQHQQQNPIGGGERPASITVYEWRLILLQIVELLIGVDRAVYIELSQRAVACGTRRNAILREQLEREARAAAVAVANAATPTTAGGKVTPPAKAQASQPTEMTSTSINDDTATSAVAATAGTEGDPSPLSMASSPEGYTSPTELHTSAPVTAVAFDKIKAAPGTPARGRVRAATPVGLHLSPTLPPVPAAGGAGASAAALQPSSANYSLVGPASTTPIAGTSVLTTPTTHELGSSALPTVATASGGNGVGVPPAPADDGSANASPSSPFVDAALLEAAAAAAEASLSAADLKERKSLATATTHAIDEALGAACTLATWVALRAMLRQHIAHLEEAAVKFADAEAAAMSFSAVVSMAGGAEAACSPTGALDVSQRAREEDEEEKAGVGLEAAAASAAPHTSALMSLPLSGTSSSLPTPSIGMAAAAAPSPAAVTPKSSNDIHYPSYASLPAAVQQELEPQLRAAAHTVLSTASYPAISVAWAEVVEDLQELLGLPDVHLAACIMCASFLRDDDRELLLCMLQDPQPHAVSDAIQANRRRVQNQSTLDFLSSYTHTAAAAAAPAHAAVGSAAGAATKGSVAAVAGGGGSTPAGAAAAPGSSSSSSPSPPTAPVAPTAAPPGAPKRGKAAPTAAAATGKAAAVAARPARSTPLPPPMSPANLTSGGPSGSHHPHGGTTATATAPPSPILSNRATYGQDVVSDDILRDLERAYRDGIARTWSEYLETEIMVPFFTSLGIAPPSNEAGMNRSSTVRTSTEDEDMDGERERDVMGDRDVGDAITNADAEGFAEEGEWESAAAGASTSSTTTTTTTASTQKPKDSKKRQQQEKKRQERERVRTKLASMLATDEGDSVLCQVATAYFFCSDEWGRAVRQDGFTFLYHHARQRVAASKEKEDWALGKKNASLATAMAHFAAVSEAARRRAEGSAAVTAKAPAPALLHGLQLAGGDAPPSSVSRALAAVTGTEAAGQGCSGTASPGDFTLPPTSHLPLTPDLTQLLHAAPFGRSSAGGHSAVVPTLPVAALDAGGSSSTYGSLRWSPYLFTGSSTPQQQSAPTHQPLPGLLSSRGHAGASGEGSLSSPNESALPPLPPQPPKAPLSFPQQLYQNLLQIPAEAPCAADFSMSQEMIERMLNMSWSAALHKRTEHCLAARPPKLDEALELALQERTVANVFFDFRARQRALGSLVNVWLASGKSREAYQVATKHFKNEKKEWTTHTQTMFTAIRYMQSMTLLVRAQAACHAYGTVIETGQFVLPQTALCEQMLQVLAPRPRGAFVLRFGDARLKLLRAKIYLKKEVWRAYSAFDDAARASKFFIEYVQDVCQLRKQLRDGELFEGVMERGAQLLHKSQFTAAQDMFKLAVQLAKAALEHAKTKQQSKVSPSHRLHHLNSNTNNSNNNNSSISTSAARLPAAPGGKPSLGGAPATSSNMASPSSLPGIPWTNPSEKSSQSLMTVTNANTGVTATLPPNPPATAALSGGAGTSASGGGGVTFHKDLHLRGAGSGSLTSGEEHGVRSHQAEEDLELPWRVTESERMLALAYVLSAEHEVNFAVRRQLLSNAVNNAYASQSSLQRWQAKGGTPKRMLTAVPLSLVVVCRALLLLKQAKKAALLLEPLVEDKLNSAQVRPPMWKELLNPTTDPLTAEDIVLRSYVNSVRLSVFLLYARCLSHVDGERALRAVRWLSALVAESESWMLAVQNQVRAAGRHIQQLKTMSSAAAANAVAGTSLSTFPFSAESSGAAAAASASPSAANRPVGRSTPLFASIGTAATGTVNANGAMTASGNVTSAAAREESSGTQTHVPSLAARARDHSPVNMPTTATAGGTASCGTSTTASRAGDPESPPGTDTSSTSRQTAASTAPLTTISVPSLTPLTTDSAGSTGSAGFALANAQAPGGGTGGVSLPAILEAATSIRVHMESQSERVTAWRALWQMGTDLHKTRRDMSMVEGDALCLAHRWEEALEAYATALVACSSDESVGGRPQAQSSRGALPGGTPGVSASMSQPGRRGVSSRSGSVSHSCAQGAAAQPTVGSSPHLGAAGGSTPALPPALRVAESNPVRLFDDADLAWLREEEDELDLAIADMQSPVTATAMHDLRAVVAAEVRRDYKAAENRVLSKLADVYKALDQPRMAIPYLKLVLEYAVENKDALLEYTSMLHLARMFTSSGCDTEAQEMWERVSTLARQYEDKEVTRETLRNIVTGQMAASMFPVVLETAAELSKLASEDEGADAAADKRFALETLAAVHLELANYKECLRTLDAREQVQERSGEWNGKLLELRARARLGLGENAEAVKVLLRWVHKAKQMRNPVEMARANVVLAAAHAADGAIYRARRCHLAALRALSMIRTPLSKEGKEMVLESARWLVHYYYLNTDEVQVDPTLKDVPPPSAGKAGGVNGASSIFLSNSGSSFEHDLHNNSGDLAAILEEDERMRAEKAAPTASEDNQDGGDADEDDVESFLGGISGSSFAGLDMNALLAGDAEKTSGKKKATSRGETEVAEAGRNLREGEERDEAEKKVPQPSPTKIMTAPPTTNSTRPPPPTTTLANVSICSRPAAAAAGTDVLESNDVAAGGGAVARGGQACPSAHEGSSEARLQGGAAAGPGSALPPLPFPDELNYQSPSKVSTLCYNNAIETMEWSVKLLFPPQVTLSPPKSTTGLHAHAGDANASLGNVHSSQSPSLVQVQQMAASCVIPYSPAEAVDFALLAFPRCTFVFYFAEYAMASSSCYDVVIRPANRNSFLRRSAQVTTLQNYHDKNALLRVAATPQPAAMVPGPGNSAASVAGKSAGKLPVEERTPTPAHSAQPHPFSNHGGAPSPGQQAQPQQQQQQQHTREALAKALSEDTILRLRDLHDELWMPVVTAFKRARLSLEDAECLMIVADPTLLGAPFPALLPNPDNCMPGDSEEPLGVQVTTLVTPSLSHLVHRGLTRSAHGRGSTGLGPFSLSGQHRRSPGLRPHHRHHRTNSLGLGERPASAIVNTIFLSDDDEGDQMNPASVTPSTTSQSPPSPPGAATMSAKVGTNSRSMSQVGERPSLDGHAAPTAPVLDMAAHADGARKAERQPSHDPFVALRIVSDDGRPHLDEFSDGSDGEEDVDEGSDWSRSVSSSSSSTSNRHRDISSDGAAKKYASRTDDAEGGSSSNGSATAGGGGGSGGAAKEGDDSDADSDVDGGGGRNSNRGGGDPRHPSTAPLLLHPGQSGARGREEEDGRGVLGADWIIHRGCTRKALVRGLCDPSSRVVMALSRPVNGGVRVADGIVSLHDLQTYFQAHPGSTASTNASAMPAKGSAANPRRESIGISVLSPTLPNDGESGGTEQRPPQPRRAASAPTPSLAHLDLFVVAVDRGVIPVSTELVTPASACLQFGCARVLRVDLLPGTSVTEAHKAFIALYLRNVEKVQRWQMALPFALALRMTMDAAIHEHEWPATVWGAFTLVGTP